jgi:hypothetical protein
MQVRTWHLELSVVALVLSAVALITSNNLIQWIGVGAVTLTFAHAQVATRLAEREEHRGRSQATVECYYMAQRYFVGKELLWLVYFVLLQAWTALVGVGLFLVYPIWRRWWRQRHPLGGRTKWTWRGPQADSYEEMKRVLQDLVRAGKLSATPTREERIDFAYSNVKLSNPAITREMVEEAADRLDQEREEAKGSSSHGP